jgi:acetyl-CoA C-acetyltransferase
LSKVFLIDSARTPIGRATKGSLVSARPDDLAASVVRTVVNRSNVPGSAVDDLQMGCGYPEGEQGYNIGRRVALLSGLPVEVPGSTVSRMCASSMQAVRTGFHAIRSGESQLHIAAGVESISRVGRTTRPQDMHPALHGDPFADIYISMGVTAENVAKAYAISRIEMDELALSSHRRAIASSDAGHSAREIVPFELADGSAITDDDGPRRDTSLEKLSTLPSAFVEGGSITAGNSCPLSDGAAALILAGQEAVERYSLKPRARILATAVCGVAPEMMGIGPIEAIRSVLKASGLTIRDIDFVELNEAFAAQVIAVCRETGIDMQRQLNPRGGAIALGHPFGMTGVRLVGALLNDLEVLDGTLGIATLCVGGGQGMAVMVERLR